MEALAWRLFGVGLGLTILFVLGAAAVAVIPWLWAGLGWWALVPATPFAFIMAAVVLGVIAAAGQ